jgi:hypothetical protein
LWHGPSAMFLSTSSLKTSTRLMRIYDGLDYRKTIVADKLTKLGYNPKIVAGLAVGKLHKKDRASSTKSSAAPLTWTSRLYRPRYLSHRRRIRLHRRVPPHPCT